jgi:PAS domain S-box-containing protein
MHDDATMTSPPALEPESGLDRRLAAIVEYCDDAIISVSLKGIVTSWNQGANRLFGYTASEMIGQSIVRIIPLERHAEEEEILARISRGETVRHFETRRLRSDDVVLDISLTVSPIKKDDGTIIGASKVARDITSRKRAEEARRKLIECSRLVGRSFFDAMVGALAEALQVRWVLLCDIDPTNPTRARTLAAWSDGERQDNFEYDLVGTPCANVIGEQMCFYPTDVASLFPDDALLTAMGAESYLGVPLRGADDRTLGLLAILHDKPLIDDLQPRETLELFAGRAAAELERLAASSANCPSSGFLGQQAA